MFPEDYWNGADVDGQSFTVIGDTLLKNFLIASKQLITY